MPGAPPPAQPAPPPAPPTNGYPHNAAPGQPYGYAPQPSPYGPPPPAYRSPQYAPPPDEVEDDEPSPPFFDLAVSTNVPLSLGGQATLELPALLLAQLELGWMPPAYGSAINGIVQSFGAYNGEVSALVDGTLADAFVLRLSAGWRPFESAGFEIFGGYTSVSLSGSVSPADVAQVAGGEFASDVAGQLLTEDVTLSSQLHNFHVALGWRWVAFDHLVIRANVGYLQTLASSSSVESPEHPEIAEKANAVVDGTLDDIYTSYVKTPTFGLGAGYRF